MSRSLNIGFVSFRFQGTDGVTLEVAKWADVLNQLGHKCFYFSGSSDRPSDCSMVVEDAHYQHPDIVDIHHKFFNSVGRNHCETLWIKEKTEYFYNHIKRFVEEYHIDLLIPQNLFCYPLNLPLTLGMTEYVIEHSFPTIAHHHDFYWERKLFLVNSIWDYLTMAFPPTMNCIQHVVINSSARHQLASRKGLASTIIPNVMFFETPAPQSDEYSNDIREALGIEPDEKLILQPTRVVQRKGIEHAIELVSRLDIQARLVISHATSDDQFGYQDRVKEYANMLKVKTIFSSEMFDEQRRINSDGTKVYSLWDVYPHADLVTYPSLFEGFGNAFLEALYFKKPVVVNNYAIFESDIKTKGFKVIQFDEFITDQTVYDTREILDNPLLRNEWTNFNYELALKYFSYTTLRNKLKILIDNFFGAN